jgi:ligand-binding sensor domain-containing protein
LPVKNYILSLFVFLLCAGDINAQVSNSKLLFYHLSEKDGLSDNQVNCFFQDSQGIMWMGTQYGLNSFDGSVFHNLQTNNTPTDYKLFSNQVNAITEDKNHVLWLATSEGLSSLDPVTNKIHSYRSEFDNSMNSLALDGNKLWIATMGGLLCFDMVEKTFRHFTNNRDGRREFVNFDNTINSLTLGRKKRLWLATVNGVWMFDVAKHQFTQFDGPENDADYDGMINTVFEDHAGKIWAGCWSKGLKQIIPENWSVKSYGSMPGTPHHIASIAEQKTINNHYTMWLTDNLTSFTEPFDKFEHHDLKPISEAAALDPHCFYVSRDNLLWISTARGVYILDPTRQLFRHHFITSQPNITSQAPTLFYQDNQLWLGGDHNLELTLFDSAFNIKKNYTAAIKQADTAYAKNELAVMGITPYGKDELWFSTSYGIFKMNKLTGKFTTVCYKVNQTGKYPYNFINGIFVNKGKIWCFPWRRGVWEYDAKTNKFNALVVKLPDGGGLPKGVNIAGAVTDSQGNIWLTDMDYGIIKYSVSTKKFDRFIDKNITPYSRALNIYYQEGKLWVVDNSTIVAINTPNNTSRGWPLPAGMNKYVYDYAPDHANNLWIATRNGLVVFNLANYSFNQYTEEDGLINNDMNGTLRTLPNGSMIYAAENYITSYAPADLLHKPTTKNLLLTSVSANDSTILNKEKAGYVVPPNSEKISFNWALVNYTNPLQNRYYGKLDKVEKDWNYVGNTGKIDYNSLPPGAYTFRFKAVTSDGLTSAEKRVEFIVKPPFWKTWWFETIFWVVAGLSLLVIIRSVRLRERKKAALQLQLSDLEMKALRAQMNPHFIFNALNSIQECIVSKHTKAAYTYLSSFSKLVRMILENSEKQFITLEDEIETLRLYLSLEKLRFNDDFEFDIRIGNNIHPSFIRIPTMIIQPFAENALWHGLIHKKGDKKLTISFEQKMGSLFCEIEDNGIGRQRSAGFKTINGTKKQSMGMKITEERLYLLQNDAAIKIDDLEKPTGEASGTKITITIPLQF